MRTISVMAEHPLGDRYQDVEATLVGGSAGIFAVWETPREGLSPLIHFASGDDGHWREVMVFDRHWLAPIIEAILEYE